MTKEEAIKIIECGEISNRWGEEGKEVERMAIKALEQSKQRFSVWKLSQRGKFIDIVCSYCFEPRIKEWGYNVVIDELTLEDKKDIMKFIEDNHMNYCECCGSKMRYKI